MFSNLSKGSLVLAPCCVHGGRLDKTPALFYVKAHVELFEPHRLKVDGNWYDVTDGSPYGGLRTLPIKKFIFTEDATRSRDDYLALMQDRNYVRECLLDDDIVDKLSQQQLLRILNIMDLDKSRRYREQ